MSTVGKVVLIGVGGTLGIMLFILAVLGILLPLVIR